MLNIYVYIVMEKKLNVHLYMSNVFLQKETYILFLRRDNYNNR